MKLLNCIFIISYSIIVGMGIICFPITYVIVFLGCTLFIWKFEVVVLINCLGLLFISSTTLSGKTLTGNAVLLSILMLSYLLSRDRLFKNSSIWRDDLAKVLVLYFFWEVLQLILATYYLSSYQFLRECVKILIFLGMFYMISSYIKNLQHLYGIIAVLLICALSESMLAILQHCSPNFYITPAFNPSSNLFYPREYFGYIFPFISKYVREARGTFGQLNGLGNFLTLFSPLGFALAFVKKIDFKRKMFFLFINIIIFLGLYFTYSRGSLLGLLSGLFLMLLLLDRKSDRKEFKIAINFLMLATIPLILYSLLSLFIEYWNSTQNLTIRLIFWNETLSHIMKSPFAFLFGTHYFPNIDVIHFQQVVDWVPLGHNSYLAIWESRGAIGLVLVVLLFIFSIRNFYFSYVKADNVYIKHISLGLMAGLTAFLVSQLFDHKLAQFFTIRTFLFMILGISIGIKKIVESNITKSVQVQR